MMWVWIVLCLSLALNLLNLAFSLVNRYLFVQLCELLADGATKVRALLFPAGQLDFSPKEIEKMQELIDNPPEPHQSLVDAAILHRLPMKKDMN